ncbi:MAG TPA: GatB/YqeY domain-containing protein [Spirochaetota bacterium]|nr:GatB/YqeY domain-containing protein [Spirochaetota bacterium]HPC42126.1 GatB/YqeY domain-containing protein [Spirochaetota bacterium]HPL19151.1 GatB/YqeY domain-containing protein [Spirochaetota bacterium]HQF10551.1 GatB/YqeY domain-containing protein [Spirochaetota bacterium]HQH99537.1 GatB/YqeY domain-containing protein [Spirochaetota bacterium]
MNLLEKIDTDLKTAMKSGDSIRTETLKMLKSDFAYEKGKTGKDLTDEQLIEVVSRSAKRRRESIKEFQKGNRQDLVDNETRQLAVVEEYLPKQMTEEEIDKYISNKVAALGTVTQKEIGKLMGELMKELKGKADGGAVKAILSKKISQ